MASEQASDDVVPEGDGELAARLRADLTAAMKRRDEVAVGALRMAFASLKVASVSGREARALTDDDVLAVLGKEVKRREEAAEAFRSGGRDDRAERELAERDVLAAYLPEPLTDDEVAALVDAVVAEGGYSSMRDMGAAMRDATARAEGRADGRRLSDAVRARLSG